MKKVNILGTLYKIYFDATDEKLPEGCDGCMDQSIHQIRIAKLESSRNSLMNLKEYKKKVTRFCTSLDYGITVAVPKAGDGTRRLQTGLLFSHRNFSKPLKKLIACENKCSS